MQYNDIDTLDRASLRALQSERLVKQVKRSYERVECFRKRMDEAGLSPDDIKGIEDLSKLPFSYKSDLRDYYPYGLFAEPMENVVRVHASSGTTGKRIVVGYTKNDLDMWAECIARMLRAVGVGKNDVVQVSFGYGLFTGGFGAHAGAEKVGATVVPMSTGNTALQIQTMIDFGVTVLFCTPSYALYLAEEIENMGVKDKLKLRIGIFGAEPWTENMRKDIEKGLNIDAYDIYGLSEVLGPGVACECREKHGMHIREDNFIVEIIDPDTGEVLPEGSTGELVFTSLTKEAFPVIRYRTRDICSLNPEKCECGCTHIRMNKPGGRSDDMLIIRGVNVFPSQIEEVLLSNGYPANYQIIIDRVNNTDTLEVLVEMTRENFSDSLGKIAEKEKELVSALKTMLGIKAKVRIVSPKTLTRSEGKAKRVIDKRNLK